VGIEGSPFSRGSNQSNHGTTLDAGDLVAVKKQSRNTKTIERYLERELAALKTLKHPNLIEFIG